MKRIGTVVTKIRMQPVHVKTKFTLEIMSEPVREKTNNLCFRPDPT